MKNLTTLVIALSLLFLGLMLKLLWEKLNGVEVTIVVVVGVIATMIVLAMKSLVVPPEESQQ